MRKMRSMSPESAEHWLKGFIAQDQSKVLHRLRQIQLNKAASTTAATPEGTGNSSSSTSVPTLDKGKRVAAQLSWSGTRLAWCRGCTTIRTFTFEDPVVAATWAWFPGRATSQGAPSLNASDTKGKAKAKDPTSELSRALCVLFRHKVHILFINSGDDYDVPLAFSATGLWAAKQGIYIQRQLETEDYKLQSVEGAAAAEAAGQDILPTVFHLNHALQDVGGVYRAEKITWTTSGIAALHGPARPFADLSERILYVGGAEGVDEPPLLATRCCDDGAVRIYSYTLDDSEPQRVAPTLSLTGKQTISTAPAHGLSEMGGGAQPQPAFASKDESQDYPGDVSDSQHVAETSLDASTHWARKPPRKSARLEHDRKVKYYGALSGEDALDRSRRVNWLQGSELRITSAHESAGATDRSGVINMMQAEDLAQLADGMARQSQGDTIIEDSTRGAFTGRPSLGPRQPSGRRSSRPIVPLAARGGRQSSGASRQPSVVLGDPNLSLNVNLDPPRSATVAPLKPSSDALDAARAHSVPDGMHDMASSYANVALLEQVAWDKDNG
ncbi:hypothetical protein K437DRAFT_31535 [Tilletiaria anomala UBC 951]|uniref:Anaphase-promoting complex subunit 1 N-terminal domain-containing protein n=1 Tax=Tilletiaria anomala (strain ATCC 24038 / CBS 436.72 / UBC 951) TaxID=1037660 RepID=A0A066VGQ4_TILAU|nr:uncharacterized protein K437DRAFT_31535 [Tilletiaria anomala UBC 951]KDN37924.1 hypothetical protein K437DRAFT_31535 [Tilletiaria anomala UBC 951]